MARDDSPWFAFYPRDFRYDRDVVTMTLEERGLYISLLCSEWTDGPIPDNIDEVAAIVGATKQSVKKAWARVRGCFLETDEGLIQPRLESERAERIARSTHLSELGRKGAKERDRRRSIRSQQLMPGLMPGFKPGISQEQAASRKPGISGDAEASDEPGLGKSQSQSQDESSLSVSRSISVHAREDELAREALPSPPPDPRSQAWQFSEEILALGVELDVVAEHLRLDLRMEAYRNGNIEAAEALLAAYDQDLIRARARALAEAIKAREVRSEFSLSTLKRAWNWGCVTRRSEAQQRGTSADAEVDLLLERAEQNREYDRASRGVA